MALLGKENIALAYALALTPHWSLCRVRNTNPSFLSLQGKPWLGAHLDYGQDFLKSLGSISALIWACCTKKYRPNPSGF